MKAIIYFPDATYSSHKAGIKACFSPPAVWDAGRGGWFCKGTEVFATFEGHHLPATLEVNMDDNVKLEYLITYSKKCGAQILEDPLAIPVLKTSDTTKPFDSTIKLEVTFCPFNLYPPAVDSEKFRGYQDALWRFKRISRVYWGKVESIMLSNKSLGLSFAHRWAWLELQPYLEDEEKLTFWRKYWDDK